MINYLKQPLGQNVKNLAVYLVLFESGVNDI